MPATDPITTYGLTAVPASASALLTSTPAYPPPSTLPPPIPVSELLPIPPDTPLARRIQAYAREHLPGPTYHHCLRVYCFGLAIRRHRFPFPPWGFTDETFFLACMLHDIGTTDDNLRGTRLSFEFRSGLLALEMLRKRPESETEADGAGAVGGLATREQAESVAEAVFRHQDLHEKGSITAVGQLLQMATILDNTGTHADLVHPSTIEDVCRHFPRQRWSDCFAETVRREMGLKPWAHTTTLGEEAFPAKVLGNKVMEPYE